MNAVILLLGLLIGQTLPDIDLAPLPVWRHRSWLTHGALMPLGVLFLAGTYPDYRIFFIGVLAALATHLLNDAGPKAWRGSAMVNFYPLPFSLPGPLSVLYIGLAAVVAAWACMRLM